MPLLTVIGNDIKIACGNTFSVTITLSGREFGADDRVLLCVRDETHRVCFRKIYEIVENAFVFEMTSGESSRLAVGKYKWDFSVYTNAVFGANGNLTGADEVLTPFTSANFEVVRVESYGKQ